MACCVLTSPVASPQRRFPDFSYITQNGRLTDFLDCVIIRWAPFRGLLPPLPIEATGVVCCPLTVSWGPVPRLPVWHTPQAGGQPLRTRGHSMLIVPADCVPWCCGLEPGKCPVELSGAGSARRCAAPASRAAFQALTGWQKLGPLVGSVLPSPCSSSPAQPWSCSFAVSGALSPLAVLVPDPDPDPDA